MQINYWAPDKRDTRQINATNLRCFYRRVNALVCGCNLFDSHVVNGLASSEAMNTVSPDYRNRVHACPQWEMSTLATGRCIRVILNLIAAASSDQIKGHDAEA